MTMGMMFIAMGSNSNMMVLRANGCRMPVKYDYFQDSESHFRITNESNITYYELADIYRLDLPTIYIHYSIGDVMVVLGLFQTIIAGLIVVNYKNKVTL